jgi:hypothetical protein
VAVSDVTPGQNGGKEGIGGIVGIKFGQIALDATSWLVVIS